MEYGSIGFKYFIQLHGILYHHKVVDYNLVERKNNLLINLLNSMLITFCVFENFACLFLLFKSVFEKN